MVLAALVEVMSASLLWLLDALVEMLAAVVEMLAASVLCAADNSGVAAVPVLAMLAASAFCTCAPALRLADCGVTRRAKH